MQITLKEWLRREGYATDEGRAQRLQPGRRRIPRALRQGLPGGAGRALPARRTIAVTRYGAHMTTRLPLGQVVATLGALSALSEVGQTPLEFIARHARADWGELDDHHREENEWSLKDGCRLSSAYHLRYGTKIWVITEADRSQTTVLLPEEYSSLPTPASTT